MGISIKTAGGLAVTGIVGFYLVNKVINFTRQSISEITEASKWKHYYKNGKDGKMVPPGYSRMTVPDDPKQEYLDDKEAQKRMREEKEAKKEPSKPTDIVPVLNAINDLVSKIFGAKSENAASTSDKATCDYDPAVEYDDWEPCEPFTEDTTEGEQLTMDEIATAVEAETNTNSEEKLD